MPTEKGKRSFISYLYYTLIIGTGLFQIYTAAFGIWSNQKIVHLTCFLLIICCREIMRAINDKKTVRLIISIILFLASLVAGLFMIINGKYLMNRLGQGYIFDVICGSVIILVVLWSAFRCLGYVLPLISFIFLLYAYFGKIFPGLLQHKGISFSRLVTYIPFSSEGIMGSAIATSAKFIVLFIIFASCLEVCGGGRFFIDLANSLMGHRRGGPAKSAVIASGLMGSISGSAIANVVGTGSFTIPLMKETGYSPEFAGAVEASASTGGQFTPPVMSSVAFIVAELLGITYGKVLVAAIIPAVLYYFAVMINVDLEAINHNLIGLPKETLPKVWYLLKRRGYLLLPIVLLVVCLGPLHLSAQRSGIYAIICSVVLSWFEKSTRVGIKEFGKVIISGVEGSIGVVSACACSGIIVGVITGTGLGSVLSRLIIQLSQGHLIIALLLTMVTTIILGMGMPTIPAYLIPAVMVVPALSKMGAEPLAAHMFILFFASMSGLTPPVALTSYTAAGLSKGDVWKTSMLAVQIAIAGFTLPYVFVYNTGLLLKGSVINVIIATLFCICGLTASACFFRGRILTKTGWPIRILCAAAAVLMIAPDYITGLIGFAVFAVAVVLDYLKKKKEVHSAE